MTLSPSDLDRLEALAKAATPGKRTALPDPTISERCLGIYVGPIPEDPDEPGRLALEDATALVVTDQGFYPPRLPDALFIAACDRETILELVEMARRARPTYDGQGDDE